MDICSFIPSCTPAGYDDNFIAEPGALMCLLRAVSRRLFYQAGDLLSVYSFLSLTPPPFSFRHSSRNLPLKDSTVALSVGVPGREKSILMPLLYTHLSSIFPANSEPLSVFSN